MNVKQALPIDVAVGILLKANGDVLLACRPEGKPFAGYWEFPGGKVEADESPENALIREIQEELAMEITDLDFLITVEHPYTDFRLTMHTYLCKSGQTTPTLTEHLQYCWQAAANMNHLDWAAADLPIVEKLNNQI